MARKHSLLYDPEVRAAFAAGINNAAKYLSPKDALEGVRDVGRFARMLEHTIADAKTVLSECYTAAAKRAQDAENAEWAENGAPAIRALLGTTGQTTKLGRLEWLEEQADACKWALAEVEKVIAEVRAEPDDPPEPASDEEE